MQAAIAAGNRIIDTFYSTERDLHMLTTVMPSYDCSGSTDFVLYNAGLSARQVDVGNGVAGDSSLLESYGQPGPGQWITIYANPGHAFIEVAGIAMDNAWYAPVRPTTPSSGPRWQPASIVPAQIHADAYGWFIERHRPGCDANPDARPPCCPHRRARGRLRSDYRQLQQRRAGRRPAATNSGSQPASIVGAAAVARLFAPTYWRYLDGQLAANDLPDATSTARGQAGATIPPARRAGTVAVRSVQQVPARVPDRVARTRLPVS